MSLKGEAYETVDEANTRLAGTVVLYDGEPVYITEVASVRETNEGGGKDKFRVFTRPLPLNDRDERTRKYISSKKFDMCPFSMGYFNYNGNAFYVSRTTRRQYSQGARRNNVSITDISCGSEQAKAPTPSWETIISNQCFVNMYHKRFPTFAQAVEALTTDPETNSVAISQSFACIIDRDLDIFYIYHRGHKCAIALQGDPGLTIPAKYHYIRHELVELGIPIKN